MPPRNEFQYLVLVGLWVIIRNLYGRHTNPRAANDFRSAAIEFGDNFGEQTVEAYNYRRAVTFEGDL